MDITKTSLPGVLMIVPKMFGDARGFLLESYHAQRYAQAGLPQQFVQDNHSRSVQGTLRGLHYQLQHPQGKLVRVVVGEVFDVAVDIRRGSPTFGQWFGALLSAENHQQMYIPPDFAHGFYVISETAEFLYKCTDFYAPGDEYGILWNDPMLGIHWPTTDPLLSDKDIQLPLLSQTHDHLPQYKG